MFPWIQYPRVPGHEMASAPDAVGAGESKATFVPASPKRLIPRCHPDRRVFSGAKDLN